MDIKYRTLYAIVTAYIVTTVVITVAWLPSGHGGQGQTETPSPRPERKPQQANHIVTQNDTWSAEGTAHKCTFDGTFEENLHKLKNLQFPASQSLMEELGFNRVPTTIPYTSLPVLVTGINSQFYGVMQGLVKTIHQQLLSKYPDIKFIIYDMGMSDLEYNKTTKYCRCEVRKMPFDRLPEHVRSLGNFAFKPIIANEFGNVWWVDSSVRFISNDLEQPMGYLKDTGALFFTYDPILNIALHTHTDTFRHFKEDPCPYMYFGEIEAGNVAFINNEVGRTILNRWVSCALDASCITPKGANKGCRSPIVMREEHIGTCHRYDQSVLSIILRRLYHEQNDYPLVKDPFRIIKVVRRQVVHYFPVGDT